MPILLVHGAWAGAWSWRDAARLLRKKGFDVYAPTLTGIAERSHVPPQNVSLSTHIADVAGLMRYEELRDVLIESMKPLYLGRKSRADRSLLDRILNMGLKLGADVFRRQSAALQTRRDSRETLASIDCPTLVLCGTEDAVCPLDLHVDMWRKLPRADLAVLNECGHLPTLEQPETVSRHLETLLERT